MPDPIEELLAPHIAKEAQLRQQIASFQQSLDNYKRELVGVQSRIQGIKEAAEALRAAPAPKRSRGPATRTRGMSAHWQKIMQAVDLWDETFTYADLTNAARNIDQNVTSETLRSQMSDYKGRGWVESTGSGEFSLTDDGRRAAGIEVLELEKDKAPGVGAPEAFGRVAELEGPEKTEQHPFRKGENVGSSPTPPASRPEAGAFDADLDDDVPF